MLDLSTPDMTARFAAAPLYLKKVIVTIEEVPVGTVVPTVLADGTEETTITADEDRRWKVTNPGGEKYLITRDKVETRYLHLDGNRYRAKGAVRAFRNPTGGDVEIMAPWGTVQRGGPDCMFAAAVDPATPDVIGSDRYIIGGQECENTYAPADVGDARG